MGKLFIPQTWLWMYTSGRKKTFCAVWKYTSGQIIASGSTVGVWKVTPVIEYWFLSSFEVSNRAQV